MTARTDSQPNCPALDSFVSQRADGSVGAVTPPFGRTASDGSRCECDLLVIGAGPTGLYATYYAGFRGLSVCVVDANDAVGGQITALFPDKVIRDVAGFAEITGAELVDALTHQASSARPHYHLGVVANELRHTDNGFEVTLSEGTVIRAARILLTVGLGNYRPRPLPAGVGWEDRGLQYRVEPLESYRDRDVVIVGGGDSALDWALHLEPVAATVTLVHHRNEFRAHPRTVADVEASTVRIERNSRITELVGGERLEQIVTTSGGVKTTIPSSILIAALGMVADLGPLRGWGVELVGQRIHVDPSMETSVPGIYAAGDVVERPAKVRLITVGFGEAATAVNHLAAQLQPNADVFPGHSTDTPSTQLRPPIPEGDSTGPRNGGSEPADVARCNPAQQL